jgi:hypothetical protein
MRARRGIRALVVAVVLSAGLSAAQAQPLAGGRVEKCKAHHCAIKLVGSGDFDGFSVANSDDYAFLTGPHFKVEYQARQCNAGDFMLTLFTYYGGRWQDDMVVYETRITTRKSGSELVDQPASLRWYPEVKTDCNKWTIRVIKQSA